MIFMMIAYLLMFYNSVEKIASTVICIYILLVYYYNENNTMLLYYFFMHRKLSIELNMLNCLNGKRYDM